MGSRAGIGSVILKVIYLEMCVQDTPERKSLRRTDWYRKRSNGYDALGMSCFRLLSVADQSKWGCNRRFFPPPHIY